MNADGGTTMPTKSRSLASVPANAPPCAAVSFQTGLTAAQSSVVTIPITTTDLTGLDVISFDTQVTYDPAVIAYLSIDPVGTVSSSFTITVNTLTPGTIIISGYGPNPLIGGGTLINLKFTTVGPVGSNSPLVLSSFTYNENTPCSTPSNGDVTIVYCPIVSFPTGLSAVRNSTFTVPITTTDLTGLNVISFDTTISYDPAVISQISVSSAGTLSSALTITVNDLTPGTLMISGYGANPLVGSGVLLNITFSAIGPVGSSSSLTFNTFTYNEDPPCSTTTDGDVTIITGNISGVVSYANSVLFKPVPSTLLSAVGSVNTSTNSAFFTGAYSLTGLGIGPYVVTPSKSNDVYAITGFDSALIAQHIVLLITLNPTQLLAADVSNNGIVTSFDAALISQWIVLIPNIGNTGTWKFLPPSRSYPEVAPDQVNQDFSAILMGEVSGNWVPPTSFAELAEPSKEVQLAPIGVGAPITFEQANTNLTLPVSVADTTGAGIVSWQFDLLYDPLVIAPQVNPVSAAGTLSNGMFVTYNVPTPGLLKVVFFGVNPLAGSGTLFKLNFTTVGPMGSSSPLIWQNFVFNEGNPGGLANYGSVTLISPTAAGVTVSGRTVDRNGIAVRGATVELVGDSGRLFRARSNAFGYFELNDVPSGETYVISVESKLYVFRPQVVEVTDNVSDIEIMAEPQ